MSMMGTRTNTMPITVSLIQPKKEILVPAARGTWRTLCQVTGVRPQGRRWTAAWVGWQQGSGQDSGVGCLSAHGQAFPHIQKIRKRWHLWQRGGMLRTSHRMKEGRRRKTLAPLTGEIMSVSRKVLISYSCHWAAHIKWLYVYLHNFASIPPQWKKFEKSFILNLCK